MSDLTGKRIPKSTLHGSISTNGSSNPLRGNVMTRGLDGYSPTVEFEETEAGIKVTITDVTGPHSAIIKSGPKGDRGDPGVYVGPGEMPEDCYIQIDPTGEAVGAQSDWNQNDPTAPDYVKNRPFYTEKSLISMDISPEDFYDEGDGVYYYFQEEYTSGIFLPSDDSNIKIVIEGTEYFLTPFIGEDYTYFMVGDDYDSFYDGNGVYNFVVKGYIEEGVPCIYIVTNINLVSPISISYYAVNHFTIPNRYLPQRIVISRTDDNNYEYDIPVPIIHIPSEYSTMYPENYAVTNKSVVYDEGLMSLTLKNQPSTHSRIEITDVKLPKSVGEYTRRTITQSIYIERLDLCDVTRDLGFTQLFLEIRLMDNRSICNVPIRYGEINYGGTYLLSGMFIDKDSKLYTIILEKTEEFYTYEIKRIL